MSFIEHPVFAICLAYMIYSVMKWFRLRKSMPPGPLGLPWMGNRHELPAIKPWKKFAEWNKRYGPVTSIFLGSTPVIILGTAQPAWDLLEKRSDIYSSRPRFVVTGEILSDNNRGLMLPNNEAWRRWRKILHSGFHAKKAESYTNIQSLESKLLLQQILDDPKNYERHLQRYAASVVVSVTYGKRIDSVDEWIVKENMESMDYLTRHVHEINSRNFILKQLTLDITVSRKYIVESWPWLLKLPRSLQWFRKEPEIRRQRDVNFLMYLLNDVKNRMKNGTVPDCLTAQTISNMGKLGMKEIEVAYAVSSPFGAGIETTAGTLTIFILAMLHFPEVLKKAQKELDSVIGFDRMPEFDDKETLPYIRAIVNETLRWRPVPILGGTPHAAICDDVYNEMFIPKGATVFANFYGIMQDPKMFPDPESFLPERFIDSPNPRLREFDLPFGFGRRICPGMHLALNSIFINVSRLIWAFNILPALDKNGKEVIPDSHNFTNGFNSRPISFDCRLLPRNGKTMACIEEEWQAAKTRLEDWR